MDVFDSTDPTDILGVECSNEHFICQHDLQSVSYKLL